MTTNARHVREEGAGTSDEFGVEPTIASSDPPCRGSSRRPSAS
jgi:hypothetical protein